MSAALDQITEETIEQVKKAQTNGFTSASGLTGYDLSGVVSLIPVNTPFFESVPRKAAPVGSKAAYWKALLNVNNQQPNPFVGQDFGGNYLTNLEQDVSAFYQPVRISDFVTRDAVDLGRNYFDVKASKVTTSLLQWRILENKGLIGGQNFALPAIGTPTVTTATTGGSIPTTTAVPVKVAARSPFNYYWGGSGVASAQGSATTSAPGSSATATVTAVRGAVAYDWFVNGFYYTTTTVNAVTITAIPTVNAAVPSTLPALSNVAVTSVPSVDGSYSAASYNGFIASLSGDYGSQGLVTPGSGTASGATITSLDGQTLTGAAQGVAEIDAMFLSIYNAQQLSPTRLVMNAQQASDIASKVFGGGNASVFLDPQGDGRVGAVAGASVGVYINKAAGGVRVPIVVDPAWIPGTIAFVTDHVAFPSSGISNVLEARTLRDVAQYDYGSALVPGGALGGPRDVWDVSSFETFVNRAPATAGLITNVKTG